MTETDRRIDVQAEALIGLLDGFDAHIVDGKPYLDENGKIRVLLTATTRMIKRQNDARS